MVTIKETRRIESISRLTGLPFPVKVEECRSTHGGAGYAMGTYITEESEVICGNCGRIVVGISEGAIGYVSDFRKLRG